MNENAKQGRRRPGEFGYEFDVWAGEFTTAYDTQGSGKIVVTPHDSDKRMGINWIVADKNEIDRLLAVNAELVAALEPFANYVRGLEPQPWSRRISMGLRFAQPPHDDPELGAYEDAKGGLSLQHCFNARAALAKAGK